MARAAPRATSFRSGGFKKISLAAGSITGAECLLEMIRCKRARVFVLHHSHMRQNNAPGSSSRRPYFDRHVQMTTYLANQALYGLCNSPLLQVSVSMRHPPQAMPNSLDGKFVSR